ncbi:hypothetical protein MRY87_13750 [bacterium]|nr:hypothetical protein [bacterium]
MGIYRPPVAVDSNTDRAFRQQPKRGLLFLIFVVYIPLTILALFARALMIVGNYPIMNLTIVDDFVRELIRNAQNIYFY